MSIIICEVFYIFLLYLQVILNIIEIYLVEKITFPVQGINTLSSPNHVHVGSNWESISAWIHHIRNGSIKTPGCPHLLTLHHPPTLEDFTRQTKKCSYKNFTQLDSLPSELLHNIYMWNAGLVHCNKLKPVLVWLIQHHPVLSENKSYELKYTPFD